MKNNQSQEINFNIFVILWGAILWSCFLFSGLVFFQTKGPIFSVANFMNAAPRSFILFGAAIMAFVGAGVIFKTLVKNSKVSSDTSEKELHQKYFAPFVIKIIMFETCSIFGMALSLIEQKRLILPFFILSLVGIIPSFPTKKKIRNTFLRR